MNNCALGKINKSYVPSYGPHLPPGAVAECSCTYLKYVFMDDLVELCVIHKSQELLHYGITIEIKYMELCMAASSLRGRTLQPRNIMKHADL